MHIDFRLEETVFQRRLEHFPAASAAHCFGGSSYEECKDVRREPLLVSSRWKERSTARIASVCRLDELPLWRLRQ